MQTRDRLILGMVVAVVAGFGLSQSLAAQTISTREIAQRSLPSVVLLVIDSGHNDRISYGSGFFVAPDVVATNFHVIEHAISGYARIVGQDAQYEIVGLVASDSSRDLALLKLKGVRGRPLSLGDSNALAIGDEIFAVGNPQGLEGTFSQGIVSSIRRRGNQSLIQITAAISPGSSGGPVLNARGDVVGVAVGGVVGGEALNFAIPILSLKSLVANQKPPVLLGAVTREPARIGPEGSLDPAAESRPRPRSNAPSLRTDDVARSRIASLIPRRGSVTELRIKADGVSGSPTEYLFKPDDETLFEFGEDTREAVDHNRDGIVDSLTLRVKRGPTQVSLQFSTDKTGLNFSPGVYERVGLDSGDRRPLPTLTLSGPMMGDCRSSRKASFQIYDSQFELTDRYIRVISFGANFEILCVSTGRTVSGTLYINYVPPR